MRSAVLMEGSFLQQGAATDSNRGITVLQTAALPLGYGAGTSILVGWLPGSQDWFFVQGFSEGDSESNRREWMAREHPAWIQAFRRDSSRPRIIWRTAWPGGYRVEGFLDPQQPVVLGEASDRATEPILICRRRSPRPGLRSLYPRSRPIGPRRPSGSHGPWPAAGRRKSR